MRISTLDTIATTFFLFFGVWILTRAAALGIASDRGPAAGTFPMIAGLMIVVFCAAALLRTWLSSPADTEAGHTRSVTLPEIARVAGIAAAVLAYIALFEHLGAFLPLPFMMIAISLIVHFRLDPRWLASIATISVAFTFVCFLIFERGLNVLLPEGPLGF